MRSKSVWPSQPPGPARLFHAKPDRLPRVHLIATHFWAGMGQRSASCFLINTLTWTTSRFMSPTWSGDPCITLQHAHMDRILSRASHQTWYVNPIFTTSALSLSALPKPPSVLLTPSLSREHRARSFGGCPLDLAGETVSWTSWNSSCVASV